MYDSIKPSENLLCQFFDMFKLYNNISSEAGGVLEEKTFWKIAADESGKTVDSVWSLNSRREFEESASYANDERDEPTIDSQTTIDSVWIFWRANFKRSKEDLLSDYVDPIAEQHMDLSTPTGMIVNVQMADNTRCQCLYSKSRRARKSEHNSTRKNHDAIFRRR